MFKLVVLSTLALTAASPSGLLGLGLGWGGPLVAPAAVVAPLGVGHGANYRGPLSLAPGQPANILAADGRPLDTLSVNLDRVAHLTARLVDGHVLKKRSLVPAVPVGWPAARIVAPGIAPAPAVAIAGAPWGHARLGHGW